MKFRNTIQLLFIVSVLQNLQMLEIQPRTSILWLLHFNDYIYKFWAISVFNLRNLKIRNITNIIWIRVKFSKMFVESCCELYNNEILAIIEVVYHLM
jgi:hypothetical protein